MSFRQGFLHFFCTTMIKGTENLLYKRLSKLGFRLKRNS